jgi:hypothetical protein
LGDQGTRFLLVRDIKRDDQTLSAIVHGR